MLTFNNDHIFTGYLKQLLHSFNLPKFRIYTAEDQKFYSEHGYEADDIIKTIGSGSYVRFVHYIKDGGIKHYYNNNWDECELKHFEYDVPILNWTKHLEIRNNTYDTYTHEYLGDYLRFIRDYNGLDLMSLYNCFSNKICSAVDYTNVTGTGGNGNIPGFTSADTNYKIFMLPVKLFKHYTIAINCPTTVEICCGVFGKYQDNRDVFKNIPKHTYKKYNNLIFTDPILYTEIDNISKYINTTTTFKNDSEGMTLAELANNECNLKMFIKIPKNNNSSIVVLEGDYRHYNDSLYHTHYKDTTGATINTTNFIKETNHTITNYENLSKNTDAFKPISPLQLLQFDTHISYPFADRLIEYLTGNVITPLDEHVDDTIRIQTVINQETPNGLFTDKMRRQLYDFMVAHREDKKLNALLHSINTGHDILGYADKDVEKYFYTTIKNDDGTESILALNNINIYNIGG